jgi:methylmalonyl-CoA mutase C-terminal domain/subunit
MQAWEVIYSGLHQTPEQIVNTGLTRRSDGIAEILSGAHNTSSQNHSPVARERALRSIAFEMIPPKDQERLKSMGVGEIFTPGTDTREIVSYLKEELE